MTNLATAYDSMWDIGAISIDGQVINQLKDLADGKKAAIFVNSASLADSADLNMKGLVELYDKYENQGLEIFMFPCNQFGKELEPWKEAEIKAFCQDKWGV